LQSIVKNATMSRVTFGLLHQKDILPYT